MRAQRLSSVALGLPKIGIAPAEYNASTASDADENPDHMRHLPSPLLRVPTNSPFRSFIHTANNASRGTVGKVEDGGLEAKDVAISSEAHDLTDGHLGEVGMLTKCFTASQIGEMYFDGGDIDGGNGVSQRHTRMGIGTSVDDQRIDAPYCPLNGLDEASFMVGMQDFQLDMVLCSEPLQAVIDLLKGHDPIDLSFSTTEQVQVWTMQHQNTWHVGFPLETIALWEHGPRLISLNSKTCECSSHFRGNVHHIRLDIAGQDHYALV
jgi:hypothetical protein